MEQRKEDAKCQGKPALFAWLKKLATWTSTEKMPEDASPPEAAAAPIGPILEMVKKQSPAAWDGNCLIPLGGRAFIPIQFARCPRADCPFCLAVRKIAERN